MLDKFEAHIKKVAKVFDAVAGGAIVAATGLVVINILLRVFFKKPLLGAYEYTGFLTAIVVGFGIAYCLVLDAHIAIDFVMDRLKKRMQSIINAITGTMILGFMAIFTVHIFRYAGQLLTSNSVSPTTQTPFYIFVYLIGVCFVVLCLVLFVKIKNYIKDVSSL